MTILKKDQMVIYSRFGVRGTAGAPLGIGKYGGADGRNPGPGKAVQYGQDVNGNPTVVVTTKQAPGGLPTKTVEFYEEDLKNQLLQAKADNRQIFIQDRYHKCISLDNPQGWREIFHWGAGLIGEETIGAAASRQFSGDAAVSSVPITFDKFFRYIRPRLTAQTAPAAVADALGVIFLDDLLSCLAYPGPNLIGYLTQQAATGVTAKVVYSANGGSTWTNSSAAPFAADEHLSKPVYRVTSDTGFRLIVGRVTTDGAAPAEIAYADVTFAAPQTTVWTAVNLSATANGDVVQSLLWPWVDRLYVASAGDIYISTTKGESFSAAIYTGSTATNVMYVAPDGTMWFAGASNLLLREENRSGVVETMVGPSGGGAFTSLAMSADGILYAGNATSIYFSKDGGASAAGWTSLKNFGSNKAVVKIKLVQDDPDFIQCVVDDSGPGTGAVWVSADGGGTWEQISTLTNGGYNDAWFSATDPNLAVIAGDDDTTRSVVHKLAP